VSVVAARKGAFIDASDEGVAVDEADFVVVGSGAGGGAAARALAAAGQRVVVLEEGPFLRAADLGYVNRREMTRLFRNQGKMAAFGRATTPILQGRCVGGTTFVNSAIIWRLPEKVLARWHAEHGLADGLRAPELDAAYAQIEEEMYVRPVEVGVNAGRQDLLMKAGAEKAGIVGQFLRRGEKGCQGSGRCLYGCPHEAKQSTAINYLRRAVDDGAVVIAHAKVTRVDISGGRAVGVHGVVDGAGPERKQPFHIVAKRAVIVAASAIQSPNLLHRSGVRARHLGLHFMAHPGTTVMGLYPERVDMWSGASQGYEALGLRDTVGVKLESINVPPEVVWARFPGAGEKFARYADKLPYAASWAVAVRADAEGRIRPSWLFGDRVDYSLTDNDMRRVAEGMKRLAEMHFLAGATEIVTGIYGIPDVLTSIDQIGEFDRAPTDPRCYSMVATHLFGGCRAGRDPSTSVVDPQLKVHGVDGLYVMDASIFPTNTGVNPQHSIMAIATVAARRLAAA